MSKGSTRRPTAVEMTEKCSTVSHRFPIGGDSCYCGQLKRDGTCGPKCQVCGRDDALVKE